MPAAAPVEDDDDSEEPEEPEPLSDDEAPDQPEDDSDTPPEDEAEASPYDSEVEEEKMPVAVRPARGRPPGVGNKRGRIGARRDDRYQGLRVFTQSVMSVMQCNFY